MAENIASGLWSFLVLFLVVFLAAYAVRHRGRLAGWLNNLDHPGQADEKEDEITFHQRRIEDHQKAINRLEKTKE